MVYNIMNRYLINAIANNEIEKIKIILKTKKIDINKQYSNGNILHYAINEYLYNKQQVNLKTIKTLLDYNKTDINLIDKYGNTALFYAIITKNEDLISLLLSYSEIELNNINKDNLSSLYIYVISGKNNINILNMLVNHPKINLIIDFPSKKEHILLRFIKDNKLKEVEYLLDNKKISSFIKINNQYILDTVLNSYNINKEMKKLILVHPKININTKISDFIGSSGLVTLGTTFERLIYKNIIDFDLIKEIIKSNKIDFSVKGNLKGIETLINIVNKNINISSNAFEIIEFISKQIMKNNNIIAKSVLLIYNEKHTSTLKKLLAYMRNIFSDMEGLIINNNILLIKSNSDISLLIYLRNYLFDIIKLFSYSFYYTNNFPKNEGSSNLLFANNINWEKLFSMISNNFNTLDTGKKKLMMRKFFNEDFKGVFFDKKIKNLLIEFKNIVEKEFKQNLKIKSISSQVFVGDNIDLIINNEYYKETGNRLKSYYISPNEFTYLTIKKIDNTNDIVFVNSLTEKNQQVKITDIIKYFFNITKSEEIDKYSKELIKLLNVERFSLFTTNDIAKTYPQVECSGSCMRKSEALGLIETDNRVKLIVIKDNLRNKLVGRALMWEGDNFILVDSAYSSGTLDIVGDNMLREFAWKIAIKKNKTFYIRLGKGGTKEKYTEYNNKMLPPNNLITSGDYAKEGLPDLILENFKFDSFFQNIIKEFTIEEMERDYGKLYLDSFKFANFEDSYISTYNTGNDILLR